jgi:hypothetical protein
MEENMKPLFRQITKILGESDLVPTSKRLAGLRKAMQDVYIGGFDNIITACKNLMRSGEVDSHKKYDWVFNQFDYAERITSFLTKRSSGTKVEKFTGYDSTPITKFEGYHGN